MNELLGIQGFLGIFALTLLLLVPIFLRSLKQQNVRIERERMERRVTTENPEMAAIRCDGCGQFNRVPVSAEKALCGSCQAELRTTSAPA